MTRQDFILTTLEGYFKDPNTCGMSNGRCKYRGDNGTRCALGQHIRDDAYVSDMEGESATTIINQNPACLTEEAAAQQLSPQQWQSIQAIHDRLASSGGIQNAYNLFDKIQNCEDICNVDLSQLKTYLV